jgi:hypothetical protein
LLLLLDGTLGEIFKPAGFGDGKRVGAELAMGKRLGCASRSVCIDIAVSAVHIAASDMWGFGVTMWEVWADGEVPYSFLRVCRAIPTPLDARGGVSLLLRFPCHNVFRTNRLQNKELLAALMQCEMRLTPPVSCPEACRPTRNPHYILFKTTDSIQIMRIQTLVSLA